MTITIEQLLLEFAKTMIKDLGKKDGHVDLWREKYGETVTNRVIKGIRELLDEGVR